jgi:hypothetical protein
MIVPIIMMLKVAMPAPSYEVNYKRINRYDRNSQTHLCSSGEDIQGHHSPLAQTSFPKDEYDEEHT